MSSAADLVDQVEAEVSSYCDFLSSVKVESSKTSQDHRDDNNEFSSDFTFDWSALSINQDENLAQSILQQDKRTLLENLRSINNCASSLTEEIFSLLEDVKQYEAENPAEHSSELIDSKMAVHLSQSIYTLVLALFKLKGSSTAHHPAIARLMQLRFLQERIAQLETKSMPQWKKWARYAESGSIDDQMCAQPELLLAQEDEVNDFAEPETKAKKQSKKDSGKYSAPKLVPMEYMGEKKMLKKDKKAERQKKRILNSDAAKTVMASLSNAPEEVQQYDPDLVKNGMLSSLF